ncbi:MAG: redox-sensing transcriptional repressor Rex [Planctomycetes bacterium]|nr:redox-sensing transcriptional repressor Rex [Planctomycetota bacterium]
MGRDRAEGNGRERQPPVTRANSIPKATCLRLSFYLRHLDSTAAQGLRTTNSARMAAALSTTAAQVRKDLSLFGQFGRPGVGYQVEELRQAIRRILGVDHRWPVVVVGVGNLGRALARYRGFAERNFDVVALFDTDPAKVGSRIGGVVVSPMEDMDKVVAERGVRLALLAVPADAAQKAAGALVRAGVTGILNFAPAVVRVPAPVVLYPADVSVLLEQLSCQISADPALLRSRRRKGGSALTAGGL